LLPATGLPDHEVGNLLAAFVSNVWFAWNVASSEERDRLARRFLGQAIVAGQTVLAGVPRSPMAPSFPRAGVKSTDAAPDRSGSGIDEVWTEATGVGQAEPHLPPGAIRITWSRLG